MDENGLPPDPAARRRALVRRMVGRPGSWTRWIATSGVWLTVWVCVYAFTGNWLLLAVAVAIDLASLLVRPHLVGDEDEFHADLRRGIVRTLREGAEPPEDPALRSDPADWFTRGDPQRFSDAPPPPSADDDAPDVVPYDSSRPPATREP